MTTVSLQDRAAVPHVFHATLLRENGVRGIVGRTFSAADAYALGRASAAWPGGTVRR